MRIQAAPVVGGRFATRFDWMYSGEVELAWMIDDGDFRCEEGSDRGGIATFAFDGLQPTVTIDTSRSTPGFCASFRFLADPEAE